MKLEGLDRCAARLPLNERLARLQSGAGFTQWLVAEIAKEMQSAPSESRDTCFSKYSTHPSLKDRLAALPPLTTEDCGPSGPAIDLLAQPDNLAERLVSETHCALAKQEQKDSKRLRRWTRRVNTQVHLRPRQVLGAFLILFGLVVGLILVIGSEISGHSAFWLSLCIGIGVLSCRPGRCRPKLALPVPDFATIKAAWENPVPPSLDQAEQFGAELRARPTLPAKRGKRALALAAVSYQALEACEYDRAYVAARLCLEVREDCVEGAVAWVVTAGALGQGQQVYDALQFLQQRTGMRSASVAWGAAWGLLLWGDWATAEAYLETARDETPHNRTLLLLLALCQSRRGKLQSAILWARQACAPAPANREHAKFLIDLLLQAGCLREAQERLQPLAAEHRSDPELSFSMTRLSLLRADFVAAEEWTAVVRKSPTGVHLLIRIGESYELARRPEQAGSLFREALAAGHYPEALLGLGRLEADRENPSEARRHVLAALDVGRPLGPKAIGPLPLFHRILAQLVALEKPVPDCRAWIGRLGDNAVPKALINTSFLVYAQEVRQAEGFLKVILGAMQPGSPPVLPNAIAWTEAPTQLQPHMPVSPGVQCVHV